MSERRTGGRETWHRLREWDKGPTDSERLAARLLPLLGYEQINPSHPLGGPDGGKDICCKRDEKDFIVAVYFPRGQKDTPEIRRKFEADLEKAKTQNAQGLVFFTNQELTLRERAECEDLGSPLLIDIHHLERIASCLDTPRGYGLRFEFLSIAMSKEEQVSFFNDRDQLLYEIRDQIGTLTEKRKQPSKIETAIINQETDGTLYFYPLGSKLMECKKCGEIFRAVRSSMSSFIFSSDGLETVTCPTCGKVQAYR